MSNICIVCGSAFSPIRRSTAKTCSKACNHKDWRNRNRDRIRANDAAWKRANKDKLRAYMRTYSKQHRERNLARSMFNAARKRARLKGMEFNIDVNDIKIPAHCPITGVVLAIDAKRATSPSLDRVDPARGYVKGNVRVISNRMNKIKADATVDELRALLAYMERG